LNNSRFFGFMAVFGLAIALATLTPLTYGSPLLGPPTSTCPTGGITNVTSPSGQVYGCGGLEFGNFSVSEIGAILGIGTMSGMNGNEVVLNWSISNAASPGDIVLIYEVQGPSTGVDLSFIGTATGLPGVNQNSVVVTELVCTGGISTGGCTNGGQVLANFGGTSSATINPNGFSESVLYNGGPQTDVWIKKDIQFNGAFTMTDFQNSNTITGTPEVGTLLMIASGLFGIGFLKRKVSISHKQQLQLIVA
jgi:hypothetical protein